MTTHRRTLRTPEDLVEAGLLATDGAEAARRVGQRYAIAMTADMAELVDARRPDDPIARQFLPDARELVSTPDELADPIGDNLKSPVKGLVHRYPDRVLLKIVSVCPVYCRFCFRREMVGPEGDGNLSRDEIAAALTYVGAHTEISEVILTGGDPLMLSAARIRETTAALEAIAHVKIIRWHTRVPVVAPERVTSELAEALASRKAAVFLAVHANHPRELTPSARSALARLADAGIGLVSQSVLLKGINDDVETLSQLMQGLVEARVKPYYLHHPDLAPGTSHFRLSIAEGQALVRALRRRVSGLAMPAYVLDIPGAHGKVPVGPVYFDEGTGRVLDPTGNGHDFASSSRQGLNDS